ncbi:endonuclease III domain-containing protein [Chloroflexota bacterium]
MDGQRYSQSLMDVYHRLMARYGPQHWWPADEPFEVIVGAILTQSAAWTNVEKAIANLKSAGVLSPEALRDIPLDKLSNLVYPSGYYNAKARKLKAFAEWLRQGYDDDLNRLFRADHLRQKLLAVHSIGPETADSILLYAAGKPVFVIDAYTRRIMERLGLATDGNSYSAYQSFFMQNLAEDTRLFNEYHALLVCLGKNLCRRKPRCPQCCLNDTCQYNKGGTR